MESIRVLLVDDHSLFRLLLRKAFEYEYPDIQIAGEAENGKDLFRILSGTTADLVLLDVNLPDIRGAEIAGRLRSEYPALKILAISAENTAETVKDMIEAGIDGFVSKQNGAIDELAKAIHTIMSGFEYFGRDIASVIYRIYVSKKKTAEVTKEFTGRERDIILLCRDGLQSKEIADRLNISFNTVNNHKKNIFQKLGINNTMEMVQYAMKKGIILLFLLLFIACNNFTGKPQPQSVFAPDSLYTPTGDAKLDSLLQLAATAPQDTNLIKLYDEIGDMYKDNDAEIAKAYFRKVGDLSEQLDWNKGRYWYTVDFANMLNRELLTDSALVIYQKALALARHEKDDSWEANMLANIGTAYSVKEWYETSLSYYMQALPFLEKENNSRKLQQVYYMISQVYTSIDAVEKAIEYSEKAVALNNEDVYSLYSLACAYSKNYQHEKANEYYEEALRICEMSNNTYVKGLIYYHLANDAIMDFDLDKAERYSQLSMKFNEPFGRAFCCNNFLMFSKLELLKGNYDQSEAYAGEALQIAIESGALESKLYAYKILSQIAVAQRKYRKDIAYGKEVDIIENAIAKATTLRASEEMAAKYETAKKDLEIENQQQVIARQNMQRALLAGGMVACVVILAMLWHMLRLRTRRNRILTEVNATKDKFFNIISHDLKNPAVALLESLKLLVRNGRAWDTDILTEYYRGLLQSAEGQVGLIFSLLDWARVHSGRLTCKIDTFPLSDLSPAISQIRTIAENKKISLTATIPDNALVNGDSNILATVVRNLLTNAIKFTPAGGQVVIAVEPDYKDKDCLIPAGYTITISDTGVGMSKEQISHLFRLDSTRSQPGTAGEQGTGLGLIVCRDLLEKHGTTLHVESEVGKGSKFWFSILS